MRLIVPDTDMGVAHGAVRIPTKQVVYPVAEVSALEVSMGEKSSAKKGALIGPVAGGGVGTVIMIGMASDDFFDLDVGSGIIIVGLFAGSGAGIGAVVGSCFKNEKWVEVPAPWSSAELQLRPDHLGGGLAWKF